MSQDRKLLKGVIKNWTFEVKREGMYASRICGTCVAYTGPELSITPGEPMITSLVRRLWSKDGVTFAETNNSIYILI